MLKHLKENMAFLIPSSTVANFEMFWHDERSKPFLSRKLVYFAYIGEHSLNEMGINKFLTCEMYAPIRF